MKIKTLIRLLQEQSQENVNKEIYFSNDEVGTIIYDSCSIDTDKDKIVIYPLNIYGETFKRK